MRNARMATHVVKRSAAAALVVISLCPQVTAGGAPVFYAPPAHHAESPPFVGSAGHARPAPFRWGWFGAEHFYPPPQYHRGYNGNVWSWTRVPLY